jgi:hypothetical protein
MATGSIGRARFPLDAALKIKGDTDDTLIGNVGDALKTSSVFAPGATDGNFLIEVAKGNIAGHTVIGRFGANESVGTTFETITGQGGLYTFAAAAQQVNVVSTSVNDTSAGTGARTVVISGLNSSHVETSETITMNGTTNVLSTNSYLRQDLSICVTVGTVGVNDGVITVTQQTSGTIMSQINVGDGRSLMAVFTIPAGKTGFILEFSFSAPRLRETETKGFITPLNESKQLAFHTGMTEGYTQVENIAISTGGITEKSDVNVDAKLDNSTGFVSIDFGILLVEN